MDDLNALVDFCPPPEREARSSAALRAGGAGLPSDYGRLISTYGVGCFDEFVWIFGDVEDNPNLDIRTRSVAARSALMERSHPRLRECLDSFGATVADLTMWGATENGDWLLWITVGGPESWPTLILEVRQRSLLVVPSSATRVLLCLLTGELSTPIFPDDFPSGEPSFSANPYSE